MSVDFTILKANLQVDISSPTFKALFKSHRHRIDPAGGITTTEQLINFLHSRTPDKRDEKDRLLRGLFIAFRIEPDPICLSLLTLIFLPMLENLYHQKQFLDCGEDSNDLWQELCWCFLQTVHNLDPDRRHTGIAAKIKSDTRKRLYDHFSGLWRRQKQIRDMEDSANRVEAIISDQRLHKRHPYPSDDEEARMESLDELAVCLKAGVIRTSDYQLLVATEVEQHPLRYLAEKNSVSYEALKKRRQRALAAVQKHLKR